MVKNPLSKVLTAVVSDYRKWYSKSELAKKVGLSRRGLYNAMSPDKEFSSFKVGTLISISRVFPITIQISNGKVKIIRWDVIQDDS